MARRRFFSRDRAIAKSNNPDDPCRNMCGLRVAEYFGTENDTQYLHKMEDLVEGLSKRFIVQAHDIPYALFTVTRAKRVFQAEAKHMYRVLGMVLLVHRHVLLVGKTGKVLVDTDPRKSGDRRKVLKAYIVYQPLANDRRNLWPIHAQP